MWPLAIEKNTRQKSLQFLVLVSVSVASMGAWDSPFGLQDPPWCRHGARVTLQMCYGLLWTLQVTANHRKTGCLSCCWEIIGARPLFHAIGIQLRRRGKYSCRYLGGGLLPIIRHKQNATCRQTHQPTTSFGEAEAKASVSNGTVDDSKDEGFQSLCRVCRSQNVEYTSVSRLC